MAEASRLVTYRLLPDNKVLGPRFGKLIPHGASSLGGSQPGRSGGEGPVRPGGFDLDVDGETVSLAANEILIQTQPVEGWRWQPIR